MLYPKTQLRLLGQYAGADELRHASADAGLFECLGDWTGSDSYRCGRNTPPLFLITGYNLVSNFRTICKPGQSYLCLRNAIRAIHLSDFARGERPGPVIATVVDSTGRCAPLVLSPPSGLLQLPTPRSHLETSKQLTPLILRPCLQPIDMLHGLPNRASIFQTRARQG